MSPDQQVKFWLSAEKAGFRLEQEFLNEVSRIVRHDKVTDDVPFNVIIGVALENLADRYMGDLTLTEHHQTIAKI